jgi:hypothetical protein
VKKIGELFIVFSVTDKTEKNSKLPGYKLNRLRGCGEELKSREVRWLWGSLRPA